MSTGFLLLACTSTSVIPVSQNQFILSTSAAPACGSTGAAKVATQMAAVETLKSGRERFIIVGANAGDNIRVVQTAPTGAFTNSTYSASGSTIYGQSNTTFTGGGPMVLGRYDQQLSVQTFNRGEPGFANAVDAKQVLGPDWQKKASTGIKTCS
tara:strand:+ start:196 stop:657 length:462 start_codon:yes stop_codon:yes gene_type:complete